jgi:LPXTG-motif cell wall-anchored protein
MGYDLDAMFATRNAGELQTSAPSTAVVTRAPGVQVGGISRPPEVTATLGNLAGWAADNKNMILFGAAAAAGLWFFVLRKRK